MFEDKNKSYEFEKWVCFEKNELWRKEAFNLFYSAEVLYEFQSIKDVDIFTKEKKLSTIFSEGIVNKAYFNYRTQRMLWAYGFECLLKGIFLKNTKETQDDVKNITPEIMKEIRSHDLIYLAKKAKIGLTEPEEFYLKILTICSVWAGRYPLPSKSHEMYEERESLPSHEALNERMSILLEKKLNGEIPRTETQSDILHSGIGGEEINIYKKLKEKLLEIK